ncbi:unnamed protein product, partial [Pleuronectes platessa]
CRFEIADYKRAVAATGSAPKPLSPVASVVYAVLGSDASITGLQGAADPAVELLKEIEGRNEDESPAAASHHTALPLLPLLALPLPALPLPAAPPLTALPLPAAPPLTALPLPPLSLPTLPLVIPKCQSTRFHTAKFIVMLSSAIIIIIGVIVLFIVIIVWLWNVPPLAEVV